MGSDVQSAQGFVLELLLVAAVGVAYACFLLVLARNKGERFFLPGFVTGALGFLILFVGLQYARAAVAGVATRTIDVTRAAVWMWPTGIVGSWFAARSVLKRLRQQNTLAVHPRVILRTVGAFMSGLGLVVLAQLAALVAQPPVARTPRPSLVMPAAPASQPPKTP
jgi:hypothetical protein